MCADFVRHNAFKITRFIFKLKATPVICVLNYKKHFSESNMMKVKSKVSGLRSREVEKSSIKWMRVSKQQTSALQVLFGFAWSRLVDFHDKQSTLFSAILWNFLE